VQRPYAPNPSQLAKGGGVSVDKVSEGRFIGGWGTGLQKSEFLPSVR